MGIDTMANNILSTHYATRSRSLDYTALGMLLPNPDPILKARGLDIETYRDMCHDALIGSCIARRKASVQALDWGLDRGQASSRANKAVQAVLDALPISTIIEQMQDCVLFGYQPMEVVWGKAGALVVPAEVVAKPPEWFCFDADNKLRFKTRAAPLFGEEAPGKKYLLPRQSPTYQNPYGLASLSLCYWPLLFKKGGLKFWLAFTEKFGSAFSVGKLPRSATDAERATLLDSLEALIQNGVATIPDDGSVELVEMAGKSASAELYEALVQHCSSEIAIALLGQNQTTQASANKASATAGLEVTRDLRDADARLISTAVNELIAWVCEVNFGPGMAAPVFSFWDQAEQDVLQAARDKSNYDAGARFTNAYWMRGYGYQEGDLLPEPVGAAALESDPNASKGVAFAEPTPSRDPLQAQTDTLVQSSAAQWSAMVDHLQVLVDSAPSVAALQQTLVQAYGDLDSTELVRLMAAGLALAELKGMDSARQEITPRPPAAFAEVAPAAQAIHIHLPVGMVNVAAAPAPAPANVQVDVHVPEQAAPTVHVAAPLVNVTNDVQPAPVTVNNTHPARAIQTVERDANDEITKTITTYEGTP